MKLMKCKKTNIINKMTTGNNASISFKIHPINRWKISIRNWCATHQC